VRRAALLGGPGRQGTEGKATRFREDKPADLDRARTTVAAWRDQNPAGTDQEMLAAFGRQFHRDYAVVLRAVLFAVDRHRARQVTGLATRTARATR
jgi:hypothetical protein